MLDMPEKEKAYREKLAIRERRRALFPSRPIRRPTTEQKTATKKKPQTYAMLCYGHQQHHHGIVTVVHSTTKTVPKPVSPGTTA